MAKRKQLFHPDEVRAKIQASQLCNRLHQHAFGKIELTATQLKASEILLRKAMPDLSSVDQNTTVEAGDSLIDLLKAIDGRTRGLPKGS